MEEVSNLPVNRKQEEEVMLQSQAAASVEENILSSKIASGRTGDVLSTLIALEKVKTNTLSTVNSLEVNLVPLVISRIL